ncbi:MAG: universal stress protein [Alphaproteobacteria bacterium]|nr:universal stress protein [Alphaproteobacteria bacterium]
MTAPTTLLVAVDLDESADPVLDAALTQASKLGGRVVLAHVVPDTALVFPEARVASATRPAGAPQEPLLLQAARTRLDALARRCTEAGVSCDEAVTHGDPAATILDLADAWTADLIVMGTHGRRGLARVLLGSVAEQVLRRARVPVLVVRVADHDAT